MSFFDTINDILNIKIIKQENDNLKNKINYLNNTLSTLQCRMETTEKLLTPEMKNAADIQNHILSLNSKEEKLIEQIRHYEYQLDELDKRIAEKRKMLIDIDDDILWEPLKISSQH